MINKKAKGNLRGVPLKGVNGGWAREMEGYEAGMGFTPASRTRLHVAQEAGVSDDPWADIAG